MRTGAAARLMLSATFSTRPQRGLLRPIDGIKKSALHLRNTFSSDELVLTLFARLCFYSISKSDFEKKILKLKKNKFRVPIFHTTYSTKSIKVWCDSKY